MFKRIKWGAYAPLPSPACNPVRVAELNKLVNLAFPNCTIDTQSVKAKELLNYDIVTITNGQEEEHHSVDRLIYHLLPYVLFSNNRWYVQSFRRASMQVDSLAMLTRMVEGYHRNFKKNPNFHL